MVIVMGIVSFLVSVIIAVLVVFLTFKLFIKVSRSVKIKDFKEGNTAVAIMVVGDLLAFGILMSKSMYPISAIIQNLFMSTAMNFGTAMAAVGTILGYIAVAYILSVVTVIVSSFLFQGLTAKLKEMKLIKNKNIAVAILLAGVVVTIAIMAQHGLADLLNSIIPAVTG